jgi:Tol biopolymer transport system component
MDLDRRVPVRVSSGLEQYTSVAADAGSREGNRRLVTTLAHPAGNLWKLPILKTIAGESHLEPVSVSSPWATNPRLGSTSLLYLSSTGVAEGLWKLENGSVTELWAAAQGGLAASPALSPDGRQICFSSRKAGATRLYVMNSDGTNVRLLTEAFEVRGAPSWSPDNKWIAVGADQGEGGRIYKLPVAGGELIRLVETLSYHPVWSPDGRFILYAGPDVGAFHPVKAITPEGEPYPIPEIYSLSGVESYRFLPDASGLVLVQGYYRTQNFWLLNFATGELRQLTNLPPGFAMRGFDVSADGKEIVFDRIRESSDIVLIELAGG